MTLVDRKTLLIKDYVDVVRGHLRNESSNPGEYKKLLKAWKIGKQSFQMPR
jgi:hypothetical protein